jgi:hypothetical protein
MVSRIKSFLTMGLAALTLATATPAQAKVRESKPLPTVDQLVTDAYHVEKPETNNRKFAFSTGVRFDNNHKPANKNADIHLESEFVNGGPFPMDYSKPATVLIGAGYSDESHIKDYIYLHWSTELGAAIPLKDPSRRHAGGVKIPSGEQFTEANLRSPFPYLDRADATFGVTYKFKSSEEDRNSENFSAGVFLARNLADYNSFAVGAEGGFKFSDNARKEGMPTDLSVSAKFRAGYSDADMYLSPSIEATFPFGVYVGGKIKNFIDFNRETSDKFSYAVEAGLDLWGFKSGVKYAGSNAFEGVRTDINSLTVEAGCEF